MHRDAIMEGFWIFQDSEYARFLHMQALQKYAKANARLQICEGYTGW